jgi:hypothetical protein
LLMSSATVFLPVSCSGLTGQLGLQQGQSLARILVPEDGRPRTKTKGWGQQIDGSNPGMVTASGWVILFFDARFCRAWHANGYAPPFSCCCVANGKIACCARSE